MIVFGGQEWGWIEPLTNFGAVLFGAGLAWVTTHLYENKREKERRLSVAFSLLFKIQSLTNEIAQFDGIVKESQAGAAADGVTGPAWTWLNSTIGFDGVQESINADELALVAMTRDTEFLMQVREVESGHRILLGVVREIEELRGRLESANLA